MDLVAEDVTIRFGGLLALDAVSIAVRPGEILGLIGPNGAGKTTLVNVLSGFARPNRGRVCVGATPLTNLPGHRFACAGVARTFQAVRLFGGMTISENIEVSCLAGGAMRAAARRRAAELLDWAGLADKGHRLANTLSYGDERRVGLLRALALQPRFLLLDEPAAGLNTAEASALRAMIAHIRDSFGCAVLVIEHNMELVMNLCERLHVLNSGRTIAIGTPAEVRAQPAFRDAYLGKREA
jgi:branched-chain amino acid transport system ATP-binding protein